ncbi:MAG: holo-ACP synthase [Pyrinomonadaceae bacterium]
MILGTGIDIVEVYRIKQTIARTPRFAERVFTDAERAYCEARGVAAAQSYAGRFAAKEAFLKALGTGWRGKITWHDVEVVASQGGSPTLNITGEAFQIVKERGAERIHVAISHTAKYAVAQVILETD